MDHFQCSPFSVSGTAPPMTSGYSTPTASIPAPSTRIADHESWTHDPMRYPVTITPPDGIPESLNVIPEEEPEIRHVSW
jgi:hypothetical protein